MTASALVDELRALPVEQIEAVVATCTAEELASLRWAWEEFWGRPDEREPGAIVGRGQLPPPGLWSWWVLMGGRAGGKTYPAANFVTREMMRMGKGAIALLLSQDTKIGRRDMIDGPSGLDTVTPPWGGFDFAPSKNLCTWRSGAKAYLFGADNVDAARGPNACLFWADDLAAFGPNGFKVFQILSLAHRLDGPDGTPCRGLMSTTPIDSEILRYVLEARDGKRKSSYVFSESSTDDNAANLTAKFLGETMAEIAGTELEQQERYGKLDLSNSVRVFRGVDFASQRIAIRSVPAGLRWVAVWIDPAVSTAAKACEVGIAAVGQAIDGRAVVLEDASGHYNAFQWPNAAIDCLERWERFAGSAHFGVETNRADAQAEALLSMAVDLRRQTAVAEKRQPRQVVRIIAIHTSKTKTERAALVVPYYQAGNIQHVPGLLVLEGQLRGLSDQRKAGPGYDRADACVYGLLDVFGLLDKVRPGSLLMPQSSFVGAFGGGALGAINVGPVQQQVQPGGMVMQMPGTPIPVGAFGRSTF